MKLLTFKTHASLKSAIKGRALHLIPYEIVSVCDASTGGQLRCTAKFTVDNIEDRNELMNRGFKAVLA